MQHIMPSIFMGLFCLLASAPAVIAQGKAPPAATPKAPPANAPATNAPPVNAPPPNAPSTNTPTTNGPGSNVPPTNAPTTNTPPTTASPSTGTPANAPLSTSSPSYLRSGNLATGSSGYQGAIGQTPWYGNQDIRRQFNLNDEQFGRLNQAYGDSWQRYQAGLKDLGKGLTDQQRADKMRDLQQGFYKSFWSGSNDVMTSPAQRQRFQQLHLQYQGYDAFQDPMLAGKLNLTPKQTEQFGQYGQDWQKSMGEMSRQYQSDSEGTVKRLNAMRQAAQDRIKSVLTPEQQKVWTQAVGEPYLFPPSVYFQSGNMAASSAPKN